MSKPAPVNPRPVLKATFASLALPGLGQILAGARLVGGLMLGAMLVGAGLIVAHLVRGLPWFESPLGAFLFRVLLRGCAILHAFAVVDAYGRTAARDDRPAAERRWAAGLNLLVPGTGYLVSKAWLRAVTGLAILAVLIVFARAGRMTYLDVIFVGMQAVMAGLAYLQLRVAAERAAQEKGELLGPAGPPVAPAAQVTALVVAVAAVIFCGFVVERSIPEAVLRNLTVDDLKLSPAPDGGVQLQIAPLRLSLTAAGPGWTAAAGRGALFSVEHRLGGELALHIQRAHPFERAERLQRRLRGKLEAEGLVLRRTDQVQLSRVSSTRMRFSGDFAGGRAVDRWEIIVPQKGFAFLLTMQCDRRKCEELAPVLERSQDSFSVGRQEGRKPGG
jgi:hypothetical protein